MPIIISGSQGTTTISGSNTTVSGSQGTTTISGSGTIVSSSAGETTYSSGSLSGSINITGSLTVSGSNTLINYGPFVSNEAGGDFDFRVESDDNANMFFVDGGNSRIGIGTATPSSILEIEGSSGDLIFEIDNNASNSSNFQIQNGAGNSRVDLVMNDGSTSTTITMKDQKVGIGDTSPSYMLDVNGTLRSVGNALFDANVTLGDAVTDVTTVTGKLTGSNGLSVTGDAIFSSKVTVQGDLDVQGIVNTITNHETELHIADKIILVASGSNEANTDGAGIHFGGSSDSPISTLLFEADSLGSTTSHLVSSNGLKVTGDFQATTNVTASQGLLVSNHITADNDVTTVSSQLTASKGLLIPDDRKILFGTGEDATIEYDENGTDELRFAGAAVTFEQDATFDNNVTLGVAATDVTTVTGKLTASNGMNMTGDAAITGSLHATGITQLQGTLEVVGASSFDANVTLGNAATDVTTVTGKLTASNGMNMTGDAAVTGSLHATGPTQLQGTLEVVGASSFDANVTLGNAATDVTTVTGKLTASNGMNMTGDAAVTGSLHATGPTQLQGTLEVVGASSFDANVTLGNATSDITTVTGKLTASNGMNMTGDAAVTGSLHATGLTQLQGTLEVVGAAQFDGAVTLGMATDVDVKITGRIAQDIDPKTDATYDLGAAGLQWKDLYVHGIGYIDQLGTDADPVSVYVNAGEIDGAVIGGESAAAATFTTLKATGISLSSNDSGTSNTVFGLNAGANIASGGNYNVIVGEQAGNDLTVGDNNILVGWQTGDVLVTGSYNVAVGDSAMGSSANDSATTAVGYHALYVQNVGSWDGDSDEGNFVGNVAVGTEAGVSVTTGRNNTLIGANCGGGNFGGAALTTGLQNTLIGNYAESAAAGTANQIAIDYGTVSQGANYATIGNASITRLYAASDGDAVLYADGTINTSDKRTKEKIEDISLGLGFINKLQPVQYEKRQPVDYDDDLKAKLSWSKDGSAPRIMEDDEKNKLRVGFLAQDVGSALEEFGFSTNNDLVYVDKNTTKQHLEYSNMIAPLVKAVQELSTTVKEQQNQIEDLKNLVSKLTSE